MRIQVEEIDSAVLGRNVLTIKDFSADQDFAEFEREYRKDYNPGYVACKIPASELRSIHRLESFGFNYIEFQISLKGRVKLYDLSAFPYRFEEVTTQEDLQKVLEIVSSCFVHDRFFVDPALNSSLSAERYKRYVEKAFGAKDEFLHKVSTLDGEIVAFVTHRDIGEDEGLLLLGGVKNEYQSQGIGLLNDQYVINELHRKGKKRFSGNFSGINYPVMNMEIRGLGLRITSTWVVMRKIYTQ
jgi:hypothetical protein